MGIFDNSEVWATSIHHLNDSKEFSHAIDIGKNETRKAAEHFSDPKAKLIADGVVSRLDSISKLSIFVACFSSVEDSLSQWRGYCPSGFGFSVGFDGDRLRAIVEPQGFRLEKCIYDDHSKQNAAYGWATRTLARLLAGLTLPNDLEAYVNDQSGAFLADFVSFAPLLKDRAFEAEREWRLVGLIHTNDPRVRVRIGRSMLVRYLPVKLNLNLVDPLVWNVLVGPTPHPQLATDAVCHYFNRLHIRNGVAASRIPYRDW